MNKKNDIGFMQGRLSPQINGKIQCFPVEFWRDELELASKNNCCLVEWTLDYEDLYLNPLILVTIKIELCKNLMVHGVILQVMLHIIRIN